MREIKFRAWDNNKKEMSNSFVLGSYPLFKNERTVSYWNLGMVQIMQYTGLKDKDGKEIYEGDILSIPAIRILDTELERNNIVTVFWSEFGSWDITEDNSLYEYNSEAEIVGNIWEEAHLNAEKI